MKAYYRCSHIHLVEIGILPFVPLLLGVHVYVYMYIHYPCVCVSLSLSQHSWQLYIIISLSFCFNSLLSLSVFPLSLFHICIYVGPSLGDVISAINGVPVSYSSAEAVLNSMEPVKQVRSTGGIPHRPKVYTAKCPGDWWSTRHTCLHFLVVPHVWSVWPVNQDQMFQSRITDN